MTRINLVGDGDFDGNGLYECADVDALVADIAAGLNTLSFDLTGDGQVDVDDLDVWLAEAGNATVGGTYLLGDANLDGVVDGLDFVIWNENKFTTTPAWCAGDFDADGVVDGLDFIHWNANKFQSSSPQAVPEPVGSVIGWLLGAMIYRRTRGKIERTRTPAAI